MTSIVVYKGDLRTIGTHIRSGNQLITDAPIDNNGKGEAFSPTDLVATALASCIFSIMGITANKHNIDIKGAYGTVTKVMADKPRRIKRIIVHIDMPKNEYSSKQIKILERAAAACPVGRSLHLDLEQVVSLDFK